MLLGYYLELFNEIGPARFAAAYDLVFNSSKFRPDISELRAAAGVSLAIPDPAMDALGVVIAKMRIHGPKLREKPGPIVREKDDEGLVLVKPERGQTIPAPVFEDRIEQTLVRVGMGSREAGVAAIACHPSLPWVESEPQYRERDAQAIEKRWAQAWGAVA